MSIRSLLVAALLSAAGCASSAAAGEPSLGTIALHLNGELLEGTPLHWSDRQVALLARDGRLWSFPPSDAKDFRKASNSFHGYSAAEMRERLAKELGKKFEIIHTGHYLVAQPRDSKQNWAPRFEEMYRQFVHYFTIRGLNPREPEFPLTAIVQPTREEFQRYAAAEGSPMGAGYLGYYSARSNRVTLFDQQSTGGDAADNFDTIVHEVTHQTAFNTGVHRRFAVVPRWLSEGLGTMFEARGVWNARNHPQRDERLNRGRLTAFQQRLSARPAGRTAELVASDRLFDVDPATAYAEAWALSFYLAEKMPKKYGEFLALTAKRKPFVDYLSAERLKDFSTVFGTDLKLLEAQFLRFMHELR